MFSDNILFNGIQTAKAETTTDQTKDNIKISKLILKTEPPPVWGRYWHKNTNKYDNKTPITQAKTTIKNDYEKNSEKICFFSAPKARFTAISDFLSVTAIEITDEIEAKEPTPEIKKKTNVK